MSTLKATWALYRDCGMDASKGLARSVWGVVALLLAFAALMLVTMITAPLGLVGGFIQGFFHAGVVGWYLSLISIGVIGRRRVQASDLRDQVGSLFIEVISVLFIFWIGSMLLAPMGSGILLPVIIGCSLLFNPVPEMIYQERSQSLALLGEALKFMQQNWPEWLVAQALAAAFLAGWGLVVHGDLQPGVLIEVAENFGPFFGFIGTGASALGRLDLVGFGGAIVLLAFTHWFLLFRGHLYRRLSGSSRRGRAWRSRMDG